MGQRLSTWRPDYGNQSYQPIDAKHNVRQLFNGLQAHAIVLWLVAPLLILAALFIPSLGPSCQEGYTNLNIGIAGMVVLHHIVAEQRVWASTIRLLTRPELTIMRQLGIIQQRRLRLVLGILEDLDLVAILSFPFVAYACDADLTRRWLRSWESVPWLAAHHSKVLNRFHFWGCSVFLSGLMGFGTFIGIIRLMRAAITYDKRPSRSSDDSESANSSEDTRLNSNEFFHLARFSELAAMPGAAALLEEMGEQRQWDLHARATPEGFRSSARKREQVAVGKFSIEALELYEDLNQKVRARMNVPRKVSFAIVSVLKLVIGSILQLWLQLSFFELSFPWLGRAASQKVLAGMAICVLQILARAILSIKIGCFGCFLAGGCVIFVAWAVAKVYYSFTCDDHVWGFLTGCVNMPSLSDGVLSS